MSLLDVAREQGFAATIIELRITPLAMKVLQAGNYELQGDDYNVFMRRV